MPLARRIPRSPEPTPLHDRALEDLTFIRDTMARAGTVTSAPGWGGGAMGATVEGGRGRGRRGGGLELGRFPAGLGCGVDCGLARGGGAGAGDRRRGHGEK